jgi:hypothetical protein
MVDDEGRGVFVMTTEIGTRYVTPGQSRDTSDSDSGEELDGPGRGRRSPARKLREPREPESDR